MSSTKSVIAQGKGKFVARARLMLLLGEQLITDEVAAVSELIKNSYDADAQRVKIRLIHVSDPAKGRIEIKDNGSGMNRETLLTGWLQLATPLKARGATREARYSAGKKRILLGEKGIGRLAVHKLGTMTEITTRLRGGPTETRMVVDWSAFEDAEEFLESVPVFWEERQPQVFVKGTVDGFEWGTQIVVSRVSPWTREKMSKLARGIDAIISPLSGLRDFEPELIIDDPQSPDIRKANVFETLQNVPYKFEAEIGGDGTTSYVYTFTRTDFPDISRVIKKTKDIRDPEEFSNNRRPVCGPIKFRLYSWELLRGEKKMVFGDSAVYEEVVRPNTGVKLFRDGFRVLPYGDEDNDWLGLDLRRVGESFEERVSRNIVIGIIDISSKLNPLLIDKSDREGLIDSQAFHDFKALIIDALTEFEAARLVDRRKLKELQERRETERDRFTKSMSELTTILDKESSRLDPVAKFEIMRLVTESKKSFESSVKRAEAPLFAAAAIGLTYMIPTHEARRDIQEAMKILRNLLQDPGTSTVSAPLKSVVELLRSAQDVVGGIAKLMQRGSDDREFKLSIPVEDAISLMKYKLKRNGIDYSIESRKPENIVGAERQIEIALVNMIDNSIYWLTRSGQKKKQLKVIIDEYLGKPILVVSDSGPGIEDDIDVITMPFFTRKPMGMGLGLFICDRIARQHEAALRLMSRNDLPGLLDGANIAIVFPKAT